MGGFGQTKCDQKPQLGAPVQNPLALVPAEAVMLDSNLHVVRSPLIYKTLCGFNSTRDALTFRHMGSVLLAHLTLK